MRLSSIIGLSFALTLAHFSTGIPIAYNNEVPSYADDKREVVDFEHAGDFAFSAFEGKRSKAAINVWPTGEGHRKRSEGIAEAPGFVAKEEKRHKAATNACRPIGTAVIVVRGADVEESIYPVCP